MRLSGKLNDPEFLFRFDSIAVLTDNPATATAPAALPATTSQIKTDDAVNAEKASQPTPDQIQQPKAQPVADSQPSEADILNKYKASFDCNKASTNVEKLTCSTAVLNQLDGLLAGTYKERMTDPAFGVDKATFKADQLAWVKTRNSCSDAACLEKSYRQRVADICGMPVISGVHPGGDCDVIQN